MDGAPHGTLVTAHEQAAGRGRHGRTWVAGPGQALLMSVVVRDLEPRHALMPLATAVAVCEAAEAVADVKCAIKWPNDVWIEGRKLAGILVEGRPQAGWAVIGVGVNVGEVPEEVRGIAVALGLRCSVLSAQCSEVVLEALLPSLDWWVTAEPADVIAAFRERDALLGTEIAWDGGHGTAAGIDESGALLVHAESGLVALDAGEVHLSPGLRD